MKWMNLVVVLALAGCGSSVSKNPAIASSSDAGDGADAGDSGEDSVDMGPEPADVGPVRDTGRDMEDVPDMRPDDMPPDDMRPDDMPPDMRPPDDMPPDDMGPTNTVPSVSAVTISPSPPSRPGDLLTCNYVFSDADGDADQSSVEWLVEGAVVGNGTTFSAYGPQDEVRCRVTPMDAVSSGAPVTSVPVVGPAGATVSAGYGHTCVLTTGGAVRCWGDNYDGRVGANASTSGGFYIPPTTPAGLSSGVTQVVAGGLMSCALQNGAVKCWGSGAWGVIGPATTSDTVTPTTIVGASVTQIATGETHVCAIQNGGLVCWGANGQGQLGNLVGNNETFGTNPAPTTATGLSSGVTKVATGQNHTCAIQNGGLKCFGYNAFGQLGTDGNLDPDVANPVPTTVPGLGFGVTDVVAGRNFTCAVHNGDLKCWGKANDGQLGYTSANTFETAPTTVPMLSGAIDALAAGGGTVCVVQNRAVKCWGDNAYDQLLSSTPGVSVTTPVTILQPTIGSISVGDSFVCAEQNGDLYCWGDNYNGQLGTAVGFGMFAPAPPTLVNY